MRAMAPIFKQGASVWSHEEPPHWARLGAGAGTWARQRSSPGLVGGTRPVDSEASTTNSPVRSLAEDGIIATGCIESLESLQRNPVPVESLSLDLESASLSFAGVEARQSLPARPLPREPASPPPELSDREEESVAGTVTRDQIREIAQTKLPDLNTNDIEQAIKSIEGTARSMGIEVT